MNSKKYIRLICFIPLISIIFAQALVSSPSQKIIEEKILKKINQIQFETIEILNSYFRKPNGELQEERLPLAISGIDQKLEFVPIFLAYNISRKNFADNSLLFYDLIIEEFLKNFKPKTDEINLLKIANINIRYLSYYEQGFIENTLKEIFDEYGKYKKPVYFGRIDIILDNQRDEIKFYAKLVLTPWVLIENVIQVSSTGEFEKSIDVGDPLKIDYYVFSDSGTNTIDNVRLASAFYEIIDEFISKKSDDEYITKFNQNIIQNLNKMLNEKLDVTTENYSYFNVSTH